MYRLLRDCGIRMDIQKFFSSERDGEASAKRPQDDGEASKVDRKLEYEKLQKREFIPTWAKEFPWIEYDKTKNMMFCKTCMKFSQLADKNSPFVSGTGTFRKDLIKTHDRSKHHSQCCKAQQAREKPTDTVMAKTVAKMNRANFEVLQKLFRTAYYIAKEKLPMAKLAGMCKLQQANGVEIKDTYINDHACREFIGAMAQTEMARTKKEIADARFVSVLSDGSTDTGIIEQEAVYVRFIRDGKSVTRLAACQPVKHADAAGVLDAIDDAFKTVGIVDSEAWERKVVCGNFDGDSVMMGRKLVLQRVCLNVFHISSFCTALLINLS